MPTSNFICLNCRKEVQSKDIGTANRNHCPNCLWSKHVDLDIPGDRKSTCQHGMRPIGLTFKLEGADKWGNPKQGELMIIHLCECCGKISINRIAGDDNPEEILKILESSKDLEEWIKEKIKRSGIRLLTNDDLQEIKTQLFGKGLV